MEHILQEGNLRLRPAGLKDALTAIPWYSDPEVLRNSEGSSVPYDAEKVRKMYSYLKSNGHFFIIELKVEDTWTPIGDACLMENSVPIVIGIPEFRSKGYGRTTLKLLITLAKNLGWEEMRVRGIYPYNKVSIRLFESAGFKRSGTIEDELGRMLNSYTLNLHRRYQ